MGSHRQGNALRWVSAESTAHRPRIPLGAGLTVFACLTLAGCGRMLGPSAGSTQAEPTAVWPHTADATEAPAAHAAPEVASALPPLMLHASRPAAALAPGGQAVLHLEDPSSWRLVTDRPDLIELSPARREDRWESHHGLRALAPGKAHVEALRPGDRLVFTVVVDAEAAREVHYPLEGSGYAVRLPALLAERLVLVHEHNDDTHQMQASFAATVRFHSPGNTTWDGSPLYVAYFQRVPIAVWERVQAEGGPPIGFEVARSQGHVLLHSPPHDLPFPERFSDEANLYLTAATMLGEAERVVESTP